MKFPWWRRGIGVSATAPCVEYFGSVTGFVCVESTFFARLVVVDTESSAVVFSFCPQSLISNERLSHLS